MKIRLESQWEAETSPKSANAPTSGAAQGGRTWNAVSPTFLLAAVLLLAALLRFGVSSFRWVGPDEGSYLLDARLILQGKVPIIDFAARQPLFLWLLAALFKVFGASLVVARLFLGVCSVLSGLLLYGLGKKVVGAEVALVGVAVAALFPFNVVWSVSVITETPAVLFATLSIWLALCALERNSPWLGLGAGLAAGAAYFTRETAVWVMVVVVLYALVVWRGSSKTKLKVFAGLLGGYLAACGAVWLYYGHYLTVRDLFFSRLNPLDVVLSQVVRGPYSMTPTTSAAIGAVQALDDIETYAHEIFAFGLFGLAGIGGTAIVTMRERRANPRPAGIGLLFLWVGVVAAMYGVRFVLVERVLFARYLLEVLPPLALLFAFTLARVLNGEHDKWLLTLAVGLTLGIYFIQHAAWQKFPGAGFYFIAGTALAALLRLRWERGSWTLGLLGFLMAAVMVLTTSRINARVPFGMQGLARTSLAVLLWLALIFAIARRQTAEARRGWRNLAATTLVLFSFIYSLGKQAQKVGPSYEGIWTPRTVRTVTKVLQSHSRPGDVVLSGGQIWAFAAGLDCFLNITHTLGLLYIPESTMQRAFSERPPEFIVMDGYTEKRTLPHASLLAGKMTALYEKVAIVQGSQYPVSIFRLRAEDPGAEQEHR